MRIGICVGEASGDILGASLMTALLGIYPECQFEGIAGTKMQKLGCNTLFPAEKLSVMGLFEVLSHYREIRGIFNTVSTYWKANPPDIFIGIDAPDFNLRMAWQLKKNTTTFIVHYVSPSVWAWRQSRIHKIVQCIDLMLTLFPFEEKFYQQYAMPVHCVGHTLADEIPLLSSTERIIEQNKLKTYLDLPDQNKLLAVLPGSRISEVNRLATPFIETLLQCHQSELKITFLVVFINNSTKTVFEQHLQQFSLPADFDIRISVGNSRQIMQVSDAILLASGTATLEAMLLKKPMLMAYKLSPLTYQIAKYLVKIPYYSIPNLLAENNLIDEVIQNDVKAHILYPKVIQLFNTSQWQEKLQLFTHLHKKLRKDASYVAAKVIIEHYDNSRCR